MNPFLQFANALPGNISQGLIWGILAIGVFITYKILDFPDLSVDGSIGTGGAVAVMLITNGVPYPVALICAFAAGCLAGLATGLMNTLLGIPNILAGILTQLALYSVNLDIMGKANRPVSVDNYPLLVSGRFVSVAGNSSFTILLQILKIAAVLAFIIIALYWFFGTEYGFTIRATGCNPNMSRAEGINTKKSTVIALVLSNGLVAFAGGVLAQYQGFSDVNMGRGAIVIGLAAVIIGDVIGRAILGKHFNFVARLIFTALGGVIYFMVLQIVIQLINLAKLPSENTKLFSAVIVMIFLAVPYLKKASKTSFRRAAKNSGRTALSETNEKGATDDADAN